MPILRVCEKPEYVVQKHCLISMSIPATNKKVRLKHKLVRVNALNKQECIPVGCVPAARRPYARVCFPGGGGVSGPGVCVWSGGACLVQRGVSGLGEGGCVWSGGCVWFGGVSGLGGWGGCVWSGGSASVPCGIPPLPPVNRMTNRCKNITLATTLLQPVITRMHSSRCIPVYRPLITVQGVSLQGALPDRDPQDRDPLDKEPPGQRPPRQRPLDKEPPDRDPLDRDSSWTETPDRDPPGQ